MVSLPVSAPFHSALMVPAADGLMPRLKNLDFKPTAVPVISNLTVQPYPADPEEYPLLLHAQIFNAVRWTETVQYFADQGITHMLEVGPGKVLRMLAVKTAKQIKTMNIDRESDLENVRAWLAEGGA